MRTQRPVPSRIAGNLGRGNAPTPFGERTEFLPRIMAFGCCMCALGIGSPGLVAGIAAFALFMAVSGDASDRALWWKGASPVDASSPAFETMVTLVALSMRLSPMERDLVAASLFALLCRFWRPAQEASRFRWKRRSVGTPCPKE